ncbi:helix-turn-helix domain-containing protein [Rhizobium sp. No.120]
MSTLAERIQIRLDATGKNATSVADEIGANRSLVRDILVGKSRNPGIETIRSICGPLECTLGYLVGSEDAQPSAEAHPVLKFFMVYGNGQRGSTFKHYSLAKACDEAKRLAAANPDITFIVLEAVDAFKAERPRIHDLGVTETDDIPF